MKPIEIRRAIVEDAAACGDVMRRSIRELCALDHKNDPQSIERWTRNKTAQSVAGWIRDGRGTLYVAEMDGEIVAVGGIDDDRSVSVNYVSPDHRFQGASLAMLRYLEDRLREKGVRVAAVSSTRTALRFYRAAGWMDTGETEMFLGWPVPLLEKKLA